MSDAVPATIPELPASASVSPAAAVAATVSPAGVDLKDPAQLLAFSLKVVKEVKARAELSDEEKAKLVVGAVKTAVSSTDLSDADKVVALAWCDAALPHVVATVALVESELKKVAVAVAAKKCCPAAPSKKVEAVPVPAVPVAAKKCCPTFFAKKV